MFRIWCVLIGYAFGVISFPFLFSRIKGIDAKRDSFEINDTGLIVNFFGKPVAATVICLDGVKFFIACLVTFLVFHENYSEFGILVRMYTIIGAFIGHMYPFYNKFKGGFPLTAIIAASALLYIPIAPVCVVIFLGIFFLTHFVSLASLFMSFSFVVLMILCGIAGLLGNNDLVILENDCLLIGYEVFVVFIYKTHIWRLFHGEENRTYFGGNIVERNVVPVKKDDLYIVSKEELNPEATPTVEPRKVKRKIKKEKSHFHEPTKVTREIIEESGPAFIDKEYKESRKQKKFIENREAELDREINPIQISLEEHNAIEYKSIDSLKAGVSTQVMATHQIDTKAIKETMEKLQLGGESNE